MTRPVEPAQVTFKWTYVGWLIALLVIITAFLGLLGVVPADPKIVWASILALALATFFGGL